jgi:hypothetical protein
LKSRTFGLGQTNWADKFWGIRGIFAQAISTQGYFLVLMGNGGGTFRLLIWNLHKIWIQESIYLNSVGFG